MSMNNSIKSNSHADIRVNKGERYIRLSYQSRMYILLRAGNASFCCYILSPNTIYPLPLRVTGTKMRKYQIIWELWRVVLKVFPNARIWTNINDDLGKRTKGVQRPKAPKRPTNQGTTLNIINYASNYSCKELDQTSAFAFSLPDGICCWQIIASLKLNANHCSTHSLTPSMPINNRWPLWVGQEQGCVLDFVIIVISLAAAISIRLRATGILSRITRKSPFQSLSLCFFLFVLTAKNFCRCELSTSFSWTLCPCNLALA